MWDLIVKGGRIVGPERIYEGSIAVKDGVIGAIWDPSEEQQAKRIVDAGGMYVFPGGIDCHVHLNDPGFTWREDYRHGTAAAAVGGITTVVDMPMQNKPALTSQTVLEDKHRQVGPNALVDYAFWGGMVAGKLDQLEGMDRGGAVSYKGFIGPVSPDYSRLDMGQAREGLERLLVFDGLAGFHCEDPAIIGWEEHRALAEGRGERQDYLKSRPVVAELIATRSVIELAREMVARIHICHVSHPEVAEVVRQAQRDGVRVTAETCVHYLVFSEQDYLDRGSAYKCAPPLRSPEARERLWDYVADGTLNCVASDHSPCEISEKDEKEHGVFGAWGGISGLQTNVQVFFDQAVHKRKLSPCLISRCMALEPARTFGLYGRKGALEVGFDGDMILLDPQREWEITPESLHYRNRFSAFGGLRGRGLPVETILRGETVARNGQPVGQHGYGQLVRRQITWEKKSRHGHTGLRRLSKKAVRQSAPGTGPAGLIP